VRSSCRRFNRNCRESDFLHCEWDLQLSTWLDVVFHGRGNVSVAQDALRPDFLSRMGALVPLWVVLQTLDGKRLDEAAPAGAVLNRVLPFGNSSFPLLGFIDPYGNTIFAGTQMRVFLPEWDALLQGLVNEPDLQFLRRVRAMAERCKSEPHIFLRFIGD
jgi:hypothetical protein